MVEQYLEINVITDQVC